ncbi:MAG: hypothetical protein V8R27_05040 [Oscillospiraceae bacterium]
MWDKLAKLDRDSPVTFKPGKTLADFGRRFSLEGMQEKFLRRLLIREQFSEDNGKPGGARGVPRHYPGD